jgi:hypothetical protein
MESTDENADPYILQTNAASVFWHTDFGLHCMRGTG